MIKEVEFNKKGENPFYGMSNTLRIFQNGSKGIVTNNDLESAWRECKDENQKAVLLSVLFSIGDITGRQHNIFAGKVDSGGNAQREAFRDVVIPFLVKKTDNIQSLMKLITEYTTMDNILATRVVTKKGKAQFVKSINMVDVYGVEAVAQYAFDIINKGTKFQKVCLAKFLSRPRTSKRKGHKKLLPETISMMKWRTKLIKLISDKCSFPYEDRGKYILFTGFYKWKSTYNQNLESFIFSSGSIKDFTKEDFHSMLETMPSDARFRVRNRVLYSDKWTNLKKWYQEYEKFKTEAQTKQRVLETRIEQGIGTQEDVEQLKQVKKQAKVNTGAVEFAEMFGQIMSGTVDKIKVQPFLDKINLPYNNLVFCDDSGSMSSRHGMNFSARQFAAFMATICLMKNPDVEARNIVGLFSRTCRMFNGITKINVAQNSLLVSKTKNIGRQALIDPEQHFIDNVTRFRQWLDSESQGSMTSISSVLSYLETWMLDANHLEELRKYPVWTFISDGNFNNKANVTASIADFFRRCQNTLGFKPYIILIDVAYNSSAKIENFEGIDNVMMVPPNPAAIEMFLTNFRDMDVFDVYTPLLSMYRSKRYEPVRQYVFKYAKTEVKERV